MVELNQHVVMVRVTDDVSQAVAEGEAREVSGAIYRMAQGVYG